MESGITNDSEPADEGPRNVMKTDSADSFQSFIYELFERDGILNDLRAYLRRHIVNVLKSAETGDPSACQKNFTQRLDLRYQAINILVAEYLMRLEFNYSFSVFVSEIPLANMVFGFAQSLMEKFDENIADLRFKDTDVWSILNYLGIQCDSEHASNIIHMYEDEKQHPLLLCILRCMPMYKEAVADRRQSSEISAASLKSLDSNESEAPHLKNTCKPECSHYSYCQKCQNNMYKIKDDYKRKKKYFAKMFQQLKSVYESEVQMMKVEERQVKRSMASHVMQLQQQRKELEETFKAREELLERGIQHKKKFLWGLARSLREQHAHMTRAMHDVRAETERLQRKEESLKTQLVEAEQILKQRGEDMRSQISGELAILERHLESMKRERENITRERSELDTLKIVQDTNVKVNKTQKMVTEEVQSHYNLLKNELAILRSYLESSQVQAKCVIERGTFTEPIETVSPMNMALNNTQSNEKASKSDDLDERLKMNQVINDFRKKNVNFSQSNLDEIYHERSRERSRSENSSEAGDTAAPDLELERGLEHDLIQRLTDNDRLRTVARQRPPRVAAACARCSPRPRTAPTPAAPNPNVHMFNFNSSVSASNLNVGWRKGAGEELSMFSNAQPRILVPGDTLPFIGVLRDRHGNTRRAMAGGARHARALAGVSKRAASPFRDKHAPVAGSSGHGVRVTAAQLTVASSSEQPADDALQASSDSEPGQQRDNRIIEKSPKPQPKETKDKLKRKDSNKESARRDKSPSSVLRSAKLRLRKLEVEAAAVEQSYRAFRRRQSELRLERALPVRPTSHVSEGLHVNLDVTRSHSTHEVDETKNYIESQFEDLQKTVRGDFDKYIRDYKTKFDIGETHFQSKPTVADRSTPIPDAFSDDLRGNYIETPLDDFRKLYTSARQPRRDNTDDESPTKTVPSNDSRTEFDYEHSARHDTLRKMKHNKQAELEILKQNINQMYHSPDNELAAAADEPQQDSESHLSSTEEHNLRVEVERFSEINNIKSQKQDMLLVVQSSVNTGDTAKGDEPSEIFAAQMTIIVSPKRPASPPERSRRSPSPEQARRSLSPEQARHSLSPEQARRNLTPKQARRSLSPEQARRNLTPEQARRSMSPEQARRSLTPEQARRSKSPEQARRSLTPEQARRSLSPEQARRSVSPEQARRSVSPEQARRSFSPEHVRRSQSPEQAAHLTRNDVLDAIFYADNNYDVSSEQMQLGKDEDDLITDYLKDGYPTDLSTERDHYSPSDEERSPISVPAADDDNFWES